MGHARLIAVLSALTCAAAAQEPPRFRTDLSLVRIDAEVTDGTRTLTGLTQADFAVVDNGIQQEIVHLSEGAEPLDLILLFDVSASMQRATRTIASSVQVALAELRPGDRVGIMAFSRSCRVVAPLTEDFAQVQNIIEKEILGKAKGQTMIMRAADRAADYFRTIPRTHRRRVVLIITDNVGSRSQSERKVVEKYWEGDIVLTGVILTNRGLETVRRYHPLVRMMTQGIDGVVEKTGGDLLKGTDAREVFHESMRRLRSRYSIYYRMPTAKPGEKRNVTIDFTAVAKQRLSGARVRARKGYVVPPPAE